MRNWICIRLDGNNLWTADLCEGWDLIRNIGGSYAKIAQVILDARQTWGNNLNVRIFPAGIHANIRYKDEI